MNTTPVFHLKLEETYYNQGFFNVRRDWDHLVRTTDGPVTLILDGFGELQARVDRRANTEHYGANPRWCAT